MPDPRKFSVRKFDSGRGESFLRKLTVGGGYFDFFGVDLNSVQDPRKFYFTKFDSGRVRLARERAEPTY